MGFPQSRQELLKVLLLFIYQRQEKAQGLQEGASQSTNKTYNLAKNRKYK